MGRSKFATRLNSFRVREREYWRELNRKPTTLDLIKRASTVAGLNSVDLNYPDHLAGRSERDLIEKMGEMGISLNGYAMRYYDDDSYRIGAFTNPDPAVRRAAIDLTRRGLDSLAVAGGTLMTLWMGQDGFDYSFQADYMALWEYTIEAIREVADDNPAIDVSIEYKPNEPRSFSVMPDVATTLLAIQEIDRPNLGVTLDFAHVLYADEDAGMCGRIGCASLAIARRPPQRRIREARRWTDGRVGPSDSDDRAALYARTNGLWRGDLFRHVPRHDRARSGLGMRREHRRCVGAAPCR
jgi:sugar phosphate isomerase/epimerase